MKVLKDLSNGLIELTQVNNKMSNELRIGLIGAGEWGKNYIETLKKNKEVSLKKIACKNLKDKKYLVKEYEVTDNWHNLTLSPEIDGIIIATPPKTHFEIASEAIKNSKPVIVEKPLSLNLKEATSLLELSKKHKVIVKVNHVYLYHPLYRLLKKQVHNKTNIKSIYSLGGNYGPFRKDVSSLWDWGPHDLSMCLDILREYPTKIKAEIIKKDYIKGIEAANIKIILDFKNKKHAEINIGNLMENKKRILRLNYEDHSYIFDPINYRDLQEKNPFQGDHILKNKKKVNIILENNPLDILINEFVKDISSKILNINDLNLSINVIKLLEIIDNILKNN